MHILIYTGCCFLNGTPALIASLISKKTGLRKINKDLLIKGISFGILAPLAYGLVVWCMQYLPIVVCFYN